MTFFGDENILVMKKNIEDFVLTVVTVVTVLTKKSVFNRKSSLKTKILTKI